MATKAPAHHALAMEIESAGHWFGANRVLHDVNLKIAQGQILALVGPSGCGVSCTQ